MKPIVSMYNSHRRFIEGLLVSGESLRGIVCALGYGNKGSLGYYLHRTGARYSHHGASRYAAHRRKIDALYLMGANKHEIAKYLRSRGVHATPNGVAWFLMSRNRME